MDRTNYTEEYRKICKAHGGNVVSAVNSALKKIDAERSADKIKGLTDIATKALEAAIKDLAHLKTDKDLAKQARELSDDLTKLIKKLDDREKKALVEAKEDSKDGGGDKDADKTAAQFLKDLEPRGETLSEQLKHCATLHKEIWTGLEKFSDKRWKCISNFAKGYDASTNGFRGFPFAIAMMVDEIGSKGESDKGIKGSKQTIVTAHTKKEDAPDDNKIKTQFINYTKNEIKSELADVVKKLEAFEDTLEKAGKKADEIAALTDKILKKLPKISSECAKAKGAVKQLNDQLDKASKNARLLIKKVEKDGGVGEEDAEFRDAYQDIPPLPDAAIKKAILALTLAVKL